MTETLANGYSSESTQRELYNEYQPDRVRMISLGICVLVLWTKVALALEGLVDYQFQSRVIQAQLSSSHVQVILILLCTLKWQIAFM